MIFTEIKHLQNEINKLTTRKKILLAKLKVRLNKRYGIKTLDTDNI